MAERYRDQYKGQVHFQVVRKVELLPYLQSTISKPDPLAKLPKGVKDARRELRIGLSVSRLDTEAGTIGAFVRVKGGSENHYLLSCNHVLAKMNKGVKGDDIYHPGKPDQKPLGYRFRVATLDECIDLTPDDVNLHDGAIAKLNSDVDHSGTVIPPGLPNAGKQLTAFAGDPIDDIRDNHPVRMIGRTSGLSTGKVSAVGLGPLPVHAPAPLGKVLFSEIIEVVGDDGRPFSLAGDSGSLVYLADTFEAIGLVFAGGPVIRDGATVDVSYVCLLDGILDYFEAKLV